MENAVERQKQALKLIEQIVDLDPDEGTRYYALKIREHLRLPMAKVLAKLWPELPILDKCKRLGIARNTYYGWLKGNFRPDKRLARKLAGLTGFDEEDIRGRLPARRP